MLEVVIFLGGSGLGALAMALFSASRLSDVLGERDVLQAAKVSLAVDVEALKARISTLRSDNKALELENQRLSAENVELQRENGRYAAELRAVKATAIKRDPKTGRMLPNPNAKRPRKSRAKAAPIACG